MTRQQAINYLSNSGFSMIQVETIVKALSTLSEVDFQELKDRYGDEVEYVVRDMISGENLRWVELPRPKKQEPTTKNETLVSLDVYKQVAKERDIAIQQLHELGYDFGQKIEPTTKNNLGVDCIDRAEVLKLMQDNWHTHNGDWAMQESMDDIRALPSVTPQEQQTFKWCTDCKEYDQEKHCCHRWSKVIRDTVEEMKQEPKTGHWKPYLKEGLRYQCSACDSRFDTPWEYCPHCGAKMAETEADNGDD